MKIDFDRYVPMGIASEGEKKTLRWCLIAGIVWSVLLFVSHYSDAYSNLFIHRGISQPVLREGAMMPKLFEIMAGSESVFLLVCAAMPVWAAYHYYYHYAESKAIYLMRRLPDRFDLHRRCLAVPAVGIVSALSIQGLLGILYYLIYIFVTPRQCLPV